MKYGTGTLIETIYGMFTVRYTYDDGDGPKIVVKTNVWRGPFEGVMGDEIPFTPEAKEKYKAVIK